MISWKRSRYILFFLTVIFCYPNISFTASNKFFKITVDTITKNQLKIVMTSMPPEDYEIKELSKITKSDPNNDLTCLMKKGFPNLPKIFRWIQVPRGKTVLARINYAKFIKKKNIFIPPFKGQTRDLSDYNSSYAINGFSSSDISGIYFKNAFYPDKAYEIGNTVFASGMKLIPLRIFPILFNPVKREMKIITSLEIDITLIEDISEMSNNESSQQDLTTLYDEMVIKFIETKSEDKTDYYVKPVDYIVIADDSFTNCEMLQELLLWKKQNGLICEMIPVSKLGDTSYAIKTFLQNRYLSFPFKYVLFVGDHKTIPLYEGFWEPSDHWYTCVEGDDYYADFSLGRLPATNVDELNEILVKILTYEKYPALGSWVSKCLLVAHKEGYPVKYTKCKEKIRTSNYSYNNFNFIPIYGAENSTNQDISNYIDEGVGLVNYRGHGNASSWISWNNTGEYFSTFNVTNLKNNGFYPVVFNICCFNAALDLEGIFTMAEAWIDSPGKGASGTLGATFYSYTDANDEMDQKIFDALLENKTANFMDAINYAKNYVIESQGEYGIENARMYLWLGDPEMNIWTAPPIDVIVEYPKFISFKTNFIQIRVLNEGKIPVKNAKITILQGLELISSNFTDDFGKITIPLSLKIESDLNLTITGKNIYPKEVVIKIKEGNYPISSRPEY